MTNKELYTSPEVDVFKIQTEGVICGSEFGEPGAPGGIPGFNDYPNF